MTEDELDPTSPQERLLDGLDPEDLDGHTIEELSDYLDAGRQPRDDSIENSPGSRIALDALSRLRQESWAMLEVEARTDSATERSWIGRVIANISRESRAGRAIPVSHPDPATHLNISEGSVRGLIRAAGDGTYAALIGTVELVGDVTVPNEEITVNTTASVAYGENLTVVAEVIRQKIAAALHRHTELNIVAINVSIQDVHTPTTPESKDA